MREILENEDDNEERKESRWKKDEWSKVGKRIAWAIDAVVDSVSSVKQVVVVTQSEDETEDEESVRRLMMMIMMMMECNNVLN